MRLSKKGVPLDIKLDLDARNFSLQDQIYDQIKQLILDHRLLSGDLLPPSRILSEQLHVSRGTVSAVYKMLALEGLVSARVGTGTVVQSVGQPEIIPPANIYRNTDSNAINTSEPVAGETSYFVQRKIPFALNSPDYETVPGKKWMQLVGRHSRSPWLNNGYSSAQGYEPFRRAIADFVRQRRGIACTSDQVIAVTNVQQGIALCAQVLLSHGEVVLTENPGYELHRDALRFFGATVQPLSVPIKETSAEEFARVYPQARAVLVTPSNQFPLCTVMDAKTRAMLVSWAVKNHTYIIEDDIDCEFSYTASQLPALASFTSNAPVIYLGSFANTVYPGIVVGYIIAPRELVRKFALAKLFNDRQISEVHAAIFADYVEQGLFDAHLRKLNRLYQLRKQELFRTLQPRLKKWGEFIDCEQGTHATFVFNDRVDDVSLVYHLRKNCRLEARPLSTTYFAGHPQSGLILGFCGLTEEKIKEAATVLEEALASSLPQFLLPSQLTIKCDSNWPS